MNVAVRDMTWWGSWRRRAAHRSTTAATRRRKPVAPVTRPWEGMVSTLRGMSIMALGLVLAGILGWLWSSLTDPHLLPITQIEIQAPFTHVDDKALRDTVSPYLKGNFFTVDVHGVQRVVESLPWVRQAEVRRVWPNAVHIVVREQVATAQWGADALVDEVGEVFHPPRATFPEGLPQLHGPQGSGQAVVKAFRDMSAIVAPLGLHIVSTRLDERRAWTLALSNGMELVLGRNDGYARLLRFVRFYHRALQGREAQVERVDLRYSNGFAVRWKTAPQGK